MLEAVRSPYVANLIDADLSDEHGYIALELIDGKDLATAMDELRTGASGARPSTWPPSNARALRSSSATDVYALGLTLCTS